LAVAADVEDGGSAAREALREVEVAGDVEARARLELHVFHDAVWPLDAAGDDGLQVGPFRQGGEAEHLEELVAVPFAAGGPVGEAVDVVETAAGEGRGLGAEVIREHAVASTGIGRGASLSGQGPGGGDGGETEGAEEEWMQ